MEKKSLWKRRIKRFFIYTSLILFIAFWIIIWLSPYGYHDGFDYKLIKHTVTINASPDKVFTYLGNSNNAREWSVFVDHIDPLPNGIKDGEVGSFRRCFCNADEKGTQWDEEITEVDLNKRRQLRIFNLVDFEMTANGLHTEQLYKDLGNGKTELTFTVFYKNHEPSLWEEIKTYIAAYKMTSIFKGNMSNIKKFVEEGH